MRYNAVSCAYILIEVFKDKNNYYHLNFDYKIDLLLHIIYEIFHENSN